MLERERKRGEVSNKVSTAKRGGPGRVELCDTSPRRRSSSFILSRGGRAQHPFSFAPISFSFSLLFPSPCVLDLHRYRFALVVSLSPFDIRIDLTRPSFRILKTKGSCLVTRHLPPGRVFVGILDDAHDDDVSHLNSIMKQKRRQCRVYGVCDVVVVVVASPINFNTR